MMAGQTTVRRGTMRAVVGYRYGSPDVLQIAEVPVPLLTDEGVLVRVRAASVNPVDKYALRGPLIVRITGSGILRPKRPLQGGDLSGVVEAVGKNVTKFKPGDEVFGTGPGTIADYVCAREARLAIKPKTTSFEEAAGVPIAGITALQGLRDKGGVKAGQNVLVNGASGGVGTFCVQIAKAMGARVTGVCSQRNVDQTRELGADKVIDYTKEDFLDDTTRYDAVLDVAGARSLSDDRKVLVPGGTFVLVGVNPKGGFVRILLRLAKGVDLNKVFRQKVIFYMAKINTPDLDILAGMMAEGKVKTVVDRTYSFEDTKKAFSYFEEGHARGKVIIRVSGDSSGRAGG